MRSTERARSSEIEQPYVVEAARSNVVLRDLIRVLAVGGLGLIGIGAFTTYRIWEEGQRDDQRPADAIVVLGAAQYDGRPSPVFAARLDHAVALYLSGAAPVLVVTGGKRTGDRTTEAAVARQFALDHHVPDGAILIEDRGRTTLESIQSVASIMRRHGLRSAIFVSDRMHMLRVLRIARDQGVVAHGSPTTTSPTDQDWGRRLDATRHELGALALYFLAGVAPVGPDAPIEP
jgi:uncharacterized SAM-binding protein YcdF (DUF218 family)